MASPADIQLVMDSLPSSSDWDENKVTTYLDSGMIPARVLATYWEKVAADTYEYVSVSESGSSRDLKSIHDNALGMARLWSDRAKVDEDKAADPGATGRVTRVAQIRRA